MLLRLPSSAAVQVGGKQVRFFCRLGFQGTTATAPSEVWIQAMKAQAPIGRVEADDARVQIVEVHRQVEHWTGEGGVVDVGRGEQKQQGQARATI